VFHNLINVAIPSAVQLRAQRVTGQTLTFFMTNA
jgi:hypothetical protein